MKVSTTNISSRDANRSPSSRGATSPSITWRCGNETGPRRVGRAATARRGRSPHRGTGAPPPPPTPGHTPPATGVDTTLVTRRDDTLRWHDWSPSTHIASIVPNARPSRLFYGALMAGRSSTARSVDVWHSPHYAMPHRSSTATVVTIHDLTFFTNPEWHERSKVSFFRRAI